MPIRVWDINKSIKDGDSLPFCKRVSHVPVQNSKTLRYEDVIYASTYDRIKAICLGNGMTNKDMSFDVVRINRIDVSTITAKIFFKETGWSTS